MGNIFDIPATRAADPAEFTQAEDENKKLSKKNFELARALAAAQRKIAEQEELIERLRSRHCQWVEAMQGDLNFLCGQLVEAGEAWAWYQASAPEQGRYAEVQSNLEQQLNGNMLEVPEGAD